MKLIINGKPECVDASISVEKLMEHQGCDPISTALVINGTFIPRQQYGAVCLNNDDVVDLVVPMQGG